MGLSARWACQTFWTWVSTEAIVLDYEDGKKNQQKRRRSRCCWPVVIVLSGEVPILIRMHPLRKHIILHRQPEC